MVSLPKLRKHSVASCATRIEKYTHKHKTITAANKCRGSFLSTPYNPESRLQSCMKPSRLRISARVYHKSLIGLTTFSPFLRFYSQSFVQGTTTHEIPDPPVLNTPKMEPKKEVPLPKNETVRSSISLAKWKWLSEFGPGFPVPSSNVQILSSPEEFYCALASHMESAKYRVCIASLYLGTGPKEKKLVNEALNMFLV